MNLVRSAKTLTLSLAALVFLCVVGCDNVSNSVAGPDSRQSLTQPPAAPSLLRANLIQTPTAASSANGAVMLMWRDNAANENGFYVERRRCGGAPWILVKKTDRDVNYLEDTGLETGCEYAYRVRAYNGLGYSDYSNEESILIIDSSFEPK